MKQHNSKIENHLYDGQIIAIGGIDSVYYPKELINKVKKSRITNLTLIYIENNTELDPAGDPTDLIYAGQVSKLITSHLGKMSKDFHHYLDEIELLPMDILAFKMQSGANRLPGIVIDYDYAKLYRDQKWLNANKISIDGKLYVMEKSLNANIGLIAVDNIDLETKNCNFDGTAYTAMEIARCSDRCYAEYCNIQKLDFDNIDIPGQYIDGFLESPNKISFMKTNW